MKRSTFISLRILRPLVGRHMCRLKRALYGLKQTSCAWRSCIYYYFSGLGFTNSEEDANIYYIMVGGCFLILVLYVDDLILIGDDKLF